VLAGVFGAALIGLLWAPWYSVGEHVNAWQSMAVNDVIFLVVGVLGIWLMVATASSSTGAVPITADVFAALGGLLASVLCVIRLIWPPDLGPGPTHLAAGAWLGTAAAIGLFLSAGASMRDERRTAPGTANVPITKLPAPDGTSA
jgi:hypothetical protein